MLYNVVLVSVVQQCESVISIHISPPSGASLLPTSNINFYIKIFVLLFLKKKILSFYFVLGIAN